MDLLNSFVEDASTKNVDLIIWTGDNPPHDSWEVNIQNKVYDITRKIKEGATLLDIQVLDHIIVSQKDFYSFADDGLIWYL